MVLMSPPRVRGAGSVQTSSRFTAVGRGNTDRSSPGWPPGPLLTYQVRPPRVQIRSSSPLTVCAPESTACPNHAPAGVPTPGLTQGRPLVIAALTASSGSEFGQVLA